MELQVIQGRKIVAGYVSKLERGSLVTDGPRLCGNDSIFQQDKAAISNVRRAKGFFMTNNVIRLDHPPCSRVLNTTEEFCGWMAREVYKKREGNSKQCMIFVKPSSPLRITCQPVISTKTKPISDVIHN